MSQQLTDPFIWDNKKYVFVCADDVYSLFDPKKFGLNPTSPHTACWKGFVIHFLLKDSRLYISKLQVYCDDNIYPIINNVSAKKEQNDVFYVYNDLNLMINYTGKIVIGTELSELHKGRAFTGPHSYLNTYDLHFSNGTLTSFKESTGDYLGF